MRRAKTNKANFDRLRISVITMVLATMLLSPLAYGARPYFKAFGADVFTGGWFNTPACAAGNEANYQDSIAGPDQRGGVVAFSKSTAGGLPTGGSSSQFGVMSAGLVDGVNNSSPPRGFYSSGVTGGTLSVKRLTFANDSSDNFGGKLQGTVRQGHCIPDYYTDKSTGAASIPNSPPAPPFDISTAASGKYIKSVGATNVWAINSSAATVASGKQLTVFVDGNVYISHNITYAASNVSNVPKFALVVRGSIYIAPGVHQLDGLYIAQPDAAANPMGRDTGIIWTCHANSTTPPNLAYLLNCGGKLTVNGALIAKQINLLRVGGDIAAAAATASEAASSANIAEVVNYTPAMVLGGPFFNQSPSGGNLKIQSLTSLPPIF